MKLYLNGQELAGQIDAEVTTESDRLLVRTPEGSFSAVAVRDGDAILVSYKGHQYHLETRRERTATAGVASGDYRAPMPGQIVDVQVSVGQTVTKGQKLLVLEAMKTQQPFNSPFDGFVKVLNAVKGAQVREGELLISVEEG